VNFYKILNEEETHHSLKYHDSLNEDPLPFNPSGDCQPGGIYFAREDILGFLGYGAFWIRRVTVPEGEPIYENPGYPKKWKAKRVILGPRRKIDLQVIKELVEEGANIHVCDDQPLEWAICEGHGANIHAKNDFVFRWAAAKGYLSLVEYLVSKGANVHVNDNEALMWAAAEGRLEVVRYLLELEKEKDICIEAGYALGWATEKGI